MAVRAPANEVKNDLPITNIASSRADLYPHLKITRETLPRMLATRRIEDDEAEYFGAFLPKTAVRILLDFVNRVFRLRTCDIPVDGSFPVPCTQYYRKRCIAPCVAHICPPERYMEAVGLVRLFLADQRGLLRKAIKKQILDHSENLDFEEAAYWRDMLQDIEKYWDNPRCDVWLDQAVDTYEIEHNDAGLTVFLVTQRGRVVVGRKVFKFKGGEDRSPDSVIAEIVATFYRYHLPKEIIVPVDFQGRKGMAEDLSLKFGRDVKILVRQNKKRVASGRALVNAHDETELEKIKPKLLPGELGRILRDHFSLNCAPNLIIAFDVAHISGEGFVAASSVWANDRFEKTSYEFHFSPASSELSAIADAVVARLRDTSLKAPDLIVLDGGKPQLNAVLRALADMPHPACGIVAAVKPAGRHSAISRFLLPDGTEVAFEESDPSHSVLQLLRDDAHDLANRVHRDLRDMGHHYELAAILPTLDESERRKLIAKAGSVKKLLAIDEAALAAMTDKGRVANVIASIRGYLAAARGPALPFVVPIRYDAEGGNAEDLRPIATK